ncbi:hypothetical protein MP631_12365 [Xanthomonas phaseoli pv. phaseoli]|uniref:hypothetical protein n=1 Tax=Xanthomonas phaseoli TaxID=1985254 RepID=UPI0020501E1E|nr:hypothetical protein [Xanthomonas phaseoli]UNW11298.1 hypothetical protein MP631_12365 [Xanthomonas phaseoli pv. phaseoli]UZB18911.1 hypothetical protein OM947_11715 [Xanthomonas phaseoli pv. phaseoli]
MAQIARVPRAISKAWLAGYQANSPDIQREAIDALWLALAQWVAGELFRRNAGIPEFDGSYSDAQKLRTTPHVERILSSDYPACLTALHENKITGKKAITEFAKWALHDGDLALSDDELVILQSIATQARSNTRDSALHAELDIWMDHRSPRWLMGWRRNARSTDDRTTIATVVPRVGVGDSIFLYMTAGEFGAAKNAALLGSLNSLPLDFIARQKV